MTIIVMPHPEHPRTGLFNMQVTKREWELVNAAGEIIQNPEFQKGEMKLSSELQQGLDLFNHFNTEFAAACHEFDIVYRAMFFAENDSDNQNNL